MSTHGPANHAKQQQGVALIALVLVLVLATSYFLLSQANGIAATSSARALLTAQSLASAKEALIARAATDDNRPGSLPCPDSNGDGNADLLVGNACPNYVGWLPWRTLDLPDPRDAASERLWYALSDTLRDDDSAEPINSDTPTTLTLNGQGGIAAIIFAPLSPLTSQNRPSNTVSDYLDGANGDGDTAYVSGSAGSTFNDIVLPISLAEIMRPAEARVAGEAANCLRTYGAANGYRYPWTTRVNGAGGAISYDDREDERLGRLPENLEETVDTASTMSDAWPANCPSPSPSSPSWWRNWKPLIFYAVAYNHRPAPSPPSDICGVAGFQGPECLMAGGTADKHFVVMVASSRLAAVAGGQPRSTGNEQNTLGNYLEGENVTLPSFETAPLSPTFNDTVRYYP